LKHGTTRGEAQNYRDFATRVGMDHMFGEANDWLLTAYGKAAPETRRIDVDSDNDSGRQTPLNQDGTRNTLTDDFQNQSFSISKNEYADRLNAALSKHDSDPDLRKDRFFAGKKRLAERFPHPRGDGPASLILEINAELKSFLVFLTQLKAEKSQNPSRQKNRAFGKKTVTKRFLP
jgi:hypothetical protein